jgi:hypothetical protein
MTNSLAPDVSAPDLPADGLDEKLDWDAFSARYFPGLRRHDLDAVAAYGAYRQGRDWRNAGRREVSRPRLTLVPNELDPAKVQEIPERPELEHLLFAAAAEQVSVSDGGFTS